MNSSIFLPQKIRVGYQERKDTYTGQLAYVIYYDQKNKLRKETSWQSWRDEKIEPNDFDNIPTSGFVLNKKVGDYVSDWNHRQAYVRIYDPRNFEFEITIPNLLYILENANSIKGKGLEGDFVYGWDGKELLLIPVESPDYVALTNYSAMLVNPEKFSAKNMIPGATYLTNKNKRLIYLGRFDYHDVQDRDIKSVKVTKKYFFVEEENQKHYDFMTSLSGKLVKCESSDPVGNYADLMDALDCQSFYSPPEKVDFLPLTPEEVLATKEESSWYVNLYAKFQGKMVSVRWSYRGSNYLERAYSSHFQDFEQEHTYHEGHEVIRSMNARYGKGSPSHLMDPNALVSQVPFFKKVVYLKNGKKTEGF